MTEEYLLIRVPLPEWLKGEPEEVIVARVEGILKVAFGAGEEHPVGLLGKTNKKGYSRQVRPFNPRYEPRRKPFRPGKRGQRLAAKESADDGLY